MENENQTANNPNTNPQTEPVQVPPPGQEGPERFSKKWILGIAAAVIFVVILTSVFVLTQSKSTQKSSTTNPTGSPSPTVSAEMKKALDEAKQSAKEYNDQLENLRNEYPWLRRLPLANEKYFVYFDLEKEKFVGRLNVQTGDDPEQLKADAINRLRAEKEIPVDNFQFEWTTP